jgi:hypothetical protein
VGVGVEVEVAEIEVAEIEVELVAGGASSSGTR